jgi:hypothetical protein
MKTSIGHRAQLYAMELTIHAIQNTRRSHLLSDLFRHFYYLVKDGFFLWSGVFLASGIAGFLFGYLVYFVLRQ